MVSELTEMTESAEAVSAGGWIFFDQDCSFCRALAWRFKSLFAKRGFRFEPLQREWVQRRLNLTGDEALAEMRVLTSAGEVFGGANAVIFLARRLWWAAPFAAVARFGPVHGLLDRSYKWVAAHRTCAVPASTKSTVPGRTRWLGLALLPLLALATKPFLPAWAFMWAMAFAIFFGCKWLTLGLALNRLTGVGRFRATAYLFAWPGMDAARFLSRDAPRSLRGPTLTRNAALALARVALGAFLLFAVARQIREPIFAGWVAMTGMILLLHFGLFALLSLMWRSFHVDAAPIMDAPLRSTSVAEFWGRRWNGAFNDLALGLVFRPMARRTGVAIATLAAFGVSGFIHETVISLPAGAGFGLPTGYFLVQGLAVLLQRQSVGLRGTISGWLFTITVVGAPAFWLFHPPFIRRVIVPFMQAIGAL